MSIPDHYWYINHAGSIDKKPWNGDKKDWTRYNTGNYAEHYQEIRELWEKRRTLDLAIKGLKVCKEKE